jgi:hypothetical protein
MSAVVPFSENTHILFMEHWNSCHLQQEFNFKRTASQNFVTLWTDVLLLCDIYHSSAFLIVIPKEKMNEQFTYYDNHGNVVATPGLKVDPPWTVMPSSKYAGTFFITDYC